MNTIKNLTIILGGLTAVILGGCTLSDDSSVSALPPKYLEVSEFQSCLETKQLNSHEQWCMPASKPSICPSASWAQLSQLKGGDKVPPCQ